MKKLKTIVIIVISCYILIPGTIYAWDDCPKGLVDDPYPGECARYVDTDNDGICDHSQPAPEDREVITQNLDVKSDNRISEQVDDSPDTQISDGLERVESDDRGSKQKLFLAFGIVLAHLIGILTYVTYKKGKAKR